MKKNRILGFPPLILCGVDYGGKSTISLLLKKMIPNRITIARKITNIKALADKDNNMYFHLNRTDICDLIEKNAHLIMNVVRMKDGIIEKYDLDNYINSKLEKAKESDIKNTDKSYKNIKLAKILNDQDNSFIGYFREPIEEIIKSSQICVFSCNYNQISILQNKAILQANYINVIPHTPELLAEKIYEEKYSSIVNLKDQENELNSSDLSFEDKKYELLVKDVEKSRKEIVRYYKNTMFSAEIEYNYNTADVSKQLEKLVKVLF